MDASIDGKPAFEVWVRAFRPGQDPVPGLMKAFGLEEHQAQAVLMRLPCRVKAGIDKPMANHFAALLRDIGGDVYIKPVSPRVGQDGPVAVSAAASPSSPAASTGFRAVDVGAGHGGAGTRPGNPFEDPSLPRAPVIAPDGRIALRSAPIEPVIAPSFANIFGGLGLRRSLTFGAIAMVLAALLWGGAMSVTGRFGGIIGVLGGFLVGLAVAHGAPRGGGARYRFIAMGLTYVAFAFATVPAIAEGFVAGFTRPSTAQAKGTEAPTEASPEYIEPHEAAEPDSEAPPEAAAPTYAEREAPAPKPHFITYVIAIPLAFLAPVLTLFVSPLDALFLFIALALALRTAWKTCDRTMTAAA